jgi:hypothetical protein
VTDLSLPPGIATRFTAQSLLHRGRMGAAYRARSAAGAEGVLRLLDTSLSRSATDRMRLARGLDKLMTVAHPGLAVPSEHGEDGGQLWFFRPFIDGVSLAERLAQGPMAMDQALSVGGQVADALHALHRAGLLHRDLCPERILLQPDGRAVIVDATVAAPVDDDHERIFGTAPFVSPEEVEGKPTSFRSDLYALGAILYASLSGEPPFDGPTAAVFKAHLSETPPPLGMELNAEVRALLDQLLDKEPRRRPFSAQKVAKTLVSYVPPALRVAEGPAGAPSAARPPMTAPAAAAPVAAPRPAAGPPPRSPKATLLGVPAITPPAAAPAPAVASPAEPTTARQPSIPPPVPSGPSSGRMPKRTMVGMPAPSVPSTSGFRDDATQQIQLEQIVEARELRGQAPATGPTAPLGTSTATKSRVDSTQQIGFEQIVEVRPSRLPPPAPPAAPPLFERTATDFPAPAPDVTGFEEEPTSMFDGHLAGAPPVAAPTPLFEASPSILVAPPAETPPPAATGFEDDEPTRMFDGHEPPTTEMALPPVDEADVSDDEEAEDEPTAMFSSSDLGHTVEDAAPAGLAAPIIAFDPPPQAAAPVTAPLGAMPTAPAARISAPPPLAGRISAPPPLAAPVAPVPMAPAPMAPGPMAPPPAVHAPPAGFPVVAPAVTPGAPPSAASAADVAPIAAQPVSAAKPKRSGLKMALIAAVLLGATGACIVGIWLALPTNDDTAGSPPAAIAGTGTLTAPTPAPLLDAGTVALLPPDLGPPDLGPPDLGPPDLGAPDLGPPDLGPPDLGPPDAGPMDDVAFMNGPRPRGRAERARWLALRRAAAASSMMSAGRPAAANASASSGIQERARAATAAGNHAEATQLYEQLTRSSPSNAGAWYALGQSRMRQRNGRGAAAALERATQLSPRNANYWATLGTARRNSGDAGGARSAFQQALRFDPTNATALRGLGQ